MSFTMQVSRVASAARGLRGWRRWLLAIALGAGAGFAMPPWYILPLMIVGLIGLVWLIDGAATPPGAVALMPNHPYLRSFLDGLLWGLGYFSVGSLWIIEAFNVPPADFAVLGPPIVGGLAVILAVFIGLSCLVWTWIVRWRPALGRGWARILLFAVLVAAFEWLRGHIFTGFPWNPIGHTWGFAAAFLQPAAWVGVYGLTALTVAFLAMPATLADHGIAAAMPSARAFDAPIGSAVRQWLPTTVAAAMALVVAGIGTMRLHTSAVEWLFSFSSGMKDNLAEHRQNPVMLRLVQPNIPQSEKWLPGSREQQLATLMRMSTLNRPEKVRHVIWPETAVPLWLAQSPDYLRAVATVAPPGGYLLTGAPRGAMTAEEAQIKSPGNREPAWNSLHVIDDTGAIRATYDKVHLVPLGEYLPLRRHFALLADTIGRGSFEDGLAHRTIRLPGLPPVSVIICYEAIFPAAVVDPDDRPAWILNVTNDSWFGASSGPYQHFTSARLRAVEEGLPLVRVANTGISAVIDRFGQVEVQLGMEKAGVIDHDLPVAGAPTLFARYGDWAFFGILTILALPLAGVAWRN